VRISNIRPIPHRGPRFCADCIWYREKACTEPRNVEDVTPIVLSAKTLVEPQRPDLRGVEAFASALDPTGIRGRQRAWPYEHRSAGWWMARLGDLCGREGRWWRRSPGDPPFGRTGVKPPAPPAPRRMSRSVDLWVGKTDDEKVPPRVRLRVFEAHGGRCWISGRKIMPGDKWEIDHEVALINGGTHSEANLAPALLAVVA
jgi:5-methylcytosine-specific restriction endonuclease McrA